MKSLRLTKQKGDMQQNFLVLNTHKSLNKKDSFLWKIWGIILLHSMCGEPPLESRAWGGSWEIQLSFGSAMVAKIPSLRVTL